MLEHRQSLGDHVDVHFGHGAEAPADGQNVFLVQHVGGLAVAAVGGENHGIGHALLDKLKRQKAVVDVGERRAVHLHHVDLQLVSVEVVVQALEDLLGALVEVEGPVDEVHAEHARRLLLKQGVLLVKAGVQDDLAGLAFGGRLEPDAKPTVTLNGLVVVDRSHGVGKREVLLSGVVLPRDALLYQVVLVVEHLVDARLAHVAPFRFLAVDRVAEVFVVRRDGLGDRAGRPARAEEMTHHFLACADLCERAVEVGIEVDPKGLLFG